MYIGIYNLFNFNFANFNILCRNQTIQILFKWVHFNKKVVNTFMLFII